MNYSSVEECLRVAERGDLIEIKKSYSEHWCVYIGCRDVIHLISCDKLEDVVKGSECI